MAKPRKKVKREVELKQAVNLYLAGWTQEQIAAEIGVDQSTISRDVSTAQERWKAATAINLESHKSAELDKLAAAESEAWQAWEGSKSGGRGPNPAYLNAALKVSELRAKLLGLNATERVELSWRQEARADILAGRVSHDALSAAFDVSLADELFREAGVSFEVIDHD